MSANRKLLGHVLTKKPNKSINLALIKYLLVILNVLPLKTFYFSVIWSKIGLTLNLSF